MLKARNEKWTIRKEEEDSFLSFSLPFLFFFFLGSFVSFSIMLTVPLIGPAE